MRHAEKPRNPLDPRLSEDGRRRAERLAGYVLTTFGRPAILVAAADKLLSRRPRETLEPLAAATGIEIRRDVPDKRSEALAKELLADPKYDGALVVASWRHKALPVLACALGAAAGQCPDPWPDGLYDLILRFDYAGAAE